jgi:hypothetical protein
MAEHPIRTALTSDRGPGQAPGRHRDGAPGGFLIVLTYAALWAVFDRESLDWHGAATLATPAFAGAGSG